MSKPLLRTLLLALMPALLAAVPPEPNARLLRAGGASSPAVHVAGGRATALVFDSEPLKDGARVEGVPVPLLVTARGVVLFPERDLGPADGAVLAVSLADGARLRLPLVTAPDAVDERVHVVHDPERTAEPEVRARLAECERQRDEAPDAVARFLTENGSDKPLITFRFAERYRGEEGPIEAQRLVEDHVSGHSYLLLRVAPEAPLAVARLTLKDAAGQELRVLRALPEPLAFLPGKGAWLVVLFKSAKEAPETLLLEDAAGTSRKINLRFSTVVRDSP